MPNELSTRERFLPSAFTAENGPSQERMDTGTQALDPRRFLPELLAVVDAFILAFGITLVAELWRFFTGQPGSVFENHFLFSLCAGGLFALAAFERGLYTFQTVRCQTQNLIKLAAVLIGTSAAILLLLFAVGELTQAALFVVLIGSSGAFVASCSIRRLLEAMLRTFAGFRDVLTHRIAIIGPPDQSHLLQELIDRQRGSDGLCRVVGTFSADWKSGACGSEAERDLNDLVEFALRHRLDEMIVTQLPASGPTLDEIQDRLSVLPIALKLYPANIAYTSEDGKICGSKELSFVTLRARPIDGLTGFVKDLIDRLTALVLLILSFPLLAAVALAIKLESAGPVFFRQRRHGFNHRTFRIWKFRTMTCLEDGAHVRQASESSVDERITRLGAFLRRTSIDELPQLINVLCGDMSLVGPRPHALAHNEYYSERIPDYLRRHVVKPGMTGLAQVEGCRGETKDVSDMKRRVEFDLRYIDRWSLALDMQIVLRTLGVLVANPKPHSPTRNTELHTLLDLVVGTRSENAYDELFDRMDIHEKPLILSFLNAHGFNMAWSDEKFRSALLESDYIVRDGIGMKIAKRLLGEDPGRNLNGSDLIPAFLQRFANRRVAILGTEDPWLSQAVDILNAEGTNIVWSHHGFEPLSFYVEEAKNRNLEVIVLAMGMPKQELVSQALRQTLRTPTMIVNGGYVVDFIAGRKPRAPRWIQRSGLEWAFRLVQEPRRLFRRYVLGNPVFLYRVLKIAGQRASAAEDTRALEHAPMSQGSTVTAMAIAAE